jgi:hypothetical protein
MRVAVGLVVIFCGGLQAQTPPADPPVSLAEAAQRAREARAAQPKASKTFTNDSLKKAPPAPDSPAAKPAASKPAESKPTDMAALEKTYRDKFTQLRNALKAAEAQDKRLREDLAQDGPNSAAPMHSYYDPSVIQKLNSQVESNHQKIATLKAQIDDLTDELRKKGLPPRWAD